MVFVVGIVWVYVVEWMVVMIFVEYVYVGFVVVEEFVVLVDVVVDMIVDLVMWGIDCFFVGIEDVVVVLCWIGGWVGYVIDYVGVGVGVIYVLVLVIFWWEGFG